MNGKEAWSDEVRAEVEHTEDWTDNDGEVRELSETDFARMTTVATLSPELQGMLRGLKSSSLTARRLAEDNDVPVSGAVA